jgi:hypothetical protein
MTRLVASIGTRLVRNWTQLYTAGMDSQLRDARRREIESDLWELETDARRCGEGEVAIAIHVLSRLLLGVSDDLTWRAEQAAASARSLRRSMWFAATAGFVGIVALWFFVQSGAPSWPPLPASPTLLPRASAPPPPPPPPSMVR